MDSITNHRVPLNSIADTSSKKMQGNSKFAQLVRANSVGDENDFGESLSHTQISIAEEFHSNSFLGDPRNISFEKENGGFAPVDSAVSLGEAINTLQSVTEIITSELYDQKWYSIGKLSYVGVNSDTKGYVPPVLTFNPTIAPATSNITNESAGTVMIENLPQLFLDPADKRSMQSAVESSNLRKKHFSSSTTLFYSQLHEIEKKKISLLESDEGKTLAIRDYISTAADLKMQVDQYATLSGNLISKITINGRTSE